MEDLLRDVIQFLPLLESVYQHGKNYNPKLLVKNCSNVALLIAIAKFYAELAPQDQQLFVDNLFQAQIVQIVRTTKNFRVYNTLIAFVNNSVCDFNFQEFEPTLKHKVRVPDTIKYIVDDFDNYLLMVVKTQQTLVFESIEGGYSLLKNPTFFTKNFQESLPEVCRLIYSKSETLTFAN
jgi:hypothetical protein